MVKYLDLKKINDSFEPELSEAVARVVRSGWYLFGKEVETFEQRFARIVEPSIAWGRGTDWMPLRLSLWLMSVWGG